MKDFTLSSVGVVALALVLGLAFHGLYPRVQPSGELAGLFVFVALVARLLLGRLWALLRKVPPPPETGAPK